MRARDPGRRHQDFARHLRARARDPAPSGARADGTKISLGICEGASKNAAVCRRALADLGERGLQAERGLLVVIDGSKALPTAVGEALGSKAAVQRCRRHKEGTCSGTCPRQSGPASSTSCARVWALERAELAERRLRELARALEAKRPGAAASLREGLAETLTVSRLGVRADSMLGRTLQTTNPIESMLSICRERSPRRQALAGRGDGPALDGGRDARRRPQLPPR
jgi:transposase-like protein